MDRQRPPDDTHDTPAISGALNPAKPRKGRVAQCVQLQEADLAVFRRIQSWFPDGTLTLSRLARLAIRHGLPALQAEFSEAAARYAANMALVSRDSQEKP